ncbi:hypothetical protein [Celeribacter persicus]|jgi:hypothetical protein|uniref:Uncharacterized protein n=1 Tax=Celeribacter persicus TaxID=1651082 RepID=A0A2T5HK35_9RHOB|nr:hypothetical protein [Celeribacter persicus]PTQ71889.1 hypothetical protein C8N42_10768 [Celeribacter persicus]
MSTSSKLNLTQATQPGTLPDASQIMRSGVNGAAITGAWTAINETIRVRNGEITTEEAVKATANSAAIGAGAGAVASVASHIARSIPLSSLALIALGAGVLYLSKQSKKTTPPAAPEAETEAAKG